MRPYPGSLVNNWSIGKKLPPAYDWNAIGLRTCLPTLNKGYKMLHFMTFSTAKQTFNNRVDGTFLTS